MESSGFHSDLLTAHEPRAKVGRVTPCAPLPFAPGLGARGATRPTFRFRGRTLRLRWNADWTGIVTACGLVFAGLCGANQGWAGEFNWHRESELKWAELEVPANGKSGFTLLLPEQTGIHFTNILDEWSSAANRVLENGSGVAAGDFDRDGRPDIFLCSLTGRNALYRNLGGGRFENATDQAGLSDTNFVSRGAVFADLNGDGWPDLLISTLGHGVRCWLNDGHGKFTDATQAAGLATQFGSTTLALADVDGNGTLDLYVANYRSDDIRDRSRIEVQRVNGQPMVAPWLRDRLVITQGGLLEFGEPDVLYLNDGQAHFRRVSWTDGSFLEETGQPLAAPPVDWGLTAAFRDLNGDGFPDLYVCNDYWTPDRIWINDGRGHFRAMARLALRHTCENSMGVDFADLDRDGHLDFLVLDMLSRNPSLRKRQALAQTKMPTVIGEISNRPQIMRNTLFHNRGDGTFEEIADFAGLPASDWSWQPVFVDVDLDGYEDLLIPAGHTRDVQDLDATARIQSLQHPWPNNLDPKAHQAAFTREMMEHVRLYPKLEMPIVAFRNLGGLRFQEVTESWGTSALGVHQGIALADLDGDGDLDFVVNNLNGQCSVYRNDSSIPRVAVRLLGLAPNSPGVGARVKLVGGAVPMQSQEMICGGRYLSGGEPLLVFAAGSVRNDMSLEVTWRSGQVSRVANVRPDRIYEINEAGAAKVQSPRSKVQGLNTTDHEPRTTDDRQESKVQSPDDPVSRFPFPASPMFQDASDLIGHVHAENAYDDFARQPLLPRRLSQLGPGVSWFDCDGDGHEDLLVGSGAGGQLALFRNRGQGKFERMIGAPVAAPVTRDQTAIVALKSARGETIVLAGSANYEDGLAAGASVRQYNLTRQRIDDSLPGAISSTGPLALADLEGDGDLDLFVGGRVVPGRYPEAASSRIYRQEGTEWRLDEANSRRLENLGMVSGVVWSDLNGDGWPELLLACDWGPIRILSNQKGTLRAWDAPVVWENQLPTLNSQHSTLNHLTGWWNGVATGDFDEDGRLDIVASNWGENTPYRASARQPLRLFYGDLLGRGVVDLVETADDPVRQALVPRYGLEVMAAGLPLLRGRFSTFKAFSEATLDEVLGVCPNRPSTLEVATLASMIFLNRGDHFEARELPREAQFAPAFGVTVADFNGDGHEDIFLSQNFFALPLHVHRFDAGRGLLLLGEGTGRFKSVPGPESGIEIYGEQRGAAAGDFNEDGRVDLAVSQNGAATKLYRNDSAKRGLRVVLRGPPENPQGVGSILRLRSGGRLGPARETHAGSGYWSQDSAVQILSAARPPAEIVVRWPGGKSATNSVPPDATEITIDAGGIRKPGR